MYRPYIKRGEWCWFRYDLINSGMTLEKKKITAFGTLGMLGIVAGVLISRPEPLPYIGLVMGVCFVIGVCVAIVNLTYTLYATTKKWGSCAGRMSGYYLVWGDIMAIWMALIQMYVRRHRKHLFNTIKRMLWAGIKFTN